MSEKESYRFKIWKVVASSHEKSLQRFLVLRRLPFLGSFYLGWVGGYILCTYYLAQMVDFFMLKFALGRFELQPSILQLFENLFQYLKVTVKPGEIAITSFRYSSSVFQ